MIITQFEYVSRKLKNMFEAEPNEGEQRMSIGRIISKSSKGWATDEFVGKRTHELQSQQLRNQGRVSR